MIQPEFLIPGIVKNIILKHYPEDSLAYSYYYTHCIKVTELALNNARYVRELLESGETKRELKN